MASSKWSSIHLVFLLIVVVNLVTADDFFAGKRDPPKDKLKCVHSESLPAAEGRNSFTYLKCSATYGKIISYVALWDLSPEGKSKSYVAITDGGIESTKVTLYVQSDVGKRLDFAVKVFEKDL